MQGLLRQEQEQVLLGFRIDHATNSRSHLGVKGKDITESLQRLRFEISQCGFALGVRNKLLSA